MWPVKVEAKGRGVGRRDVLVSKCPSTGCGCEEYLPGKPVMRGSGQVGWMAECLECRRQYVAYLDGTVSIPRWVQAHEEAVRKAKMKQEDERAEIREKMGRRVATDSDARWE